MMVVPGLAFAAATAPRKLQSLGAAVQADAAAVSSVRSTVIEANIGVMVAVFILFEAAPGARCLLLRVSRDASEKGDKASAATINPATTIRQKANRAVFLDRA